MPSFSIVSPQFAAALIFLAIGCWAMWRRSHHSRRRWQLSAAAAAIGVFLSVGAVLTLANVYFRYLPTSRDVANVVGDERNWPNFVDVVHTESAAAVKKWPNGLVVHLTVPDRGSGFGASKALVWLPPQYFTDPTGRFPVVYLFHGSPGVPASMRR